MKKILAIFILICMLTPAIAGCSGDNGGSAAEKPQASWESGSILQGLDEIGENLQKIIDAGKLVVYTDPNFAPFEFHGADGKPVGVDMEIANVIANELGVALEIVEAEFDSILVAISTGRGDIAISGMTITDERKESVDFSAPYIKSVQYLILSDSSDITVMEDLAGKKVGVALGYTGQYIMEDEVGDGGVLNGAGTELIEYPSALEATLDMKNGRVDAVIMDELVAKNIAATQSGIKAVELKYSDGGITDEEFGVVIPKGKEDLLDLTDKIVKRLVDAGTISEWVVYFGE